MKFIEWVNNFTEEDWVEFRDDPELSTSVWASIHNLTPYEALLKIKEEMSIWSR